MDSILEQVIVTDVSEESIFLMCQKFVLESKKITEQKKEGLLPDDYTPPFNVCEILVETELNIMLSRYLDICRCNQCRTDIICLALRELPARYISDTRNVDAIQQIATEYMEKTMIAVHKAIKHVFSRPRSSCKKVVTILWKTRESIDWIN
jgi:competence protein ComFB